ncbi:VOC family protein [Polyangium aurulentum]|uniref:VOC family protein n=1 Tax=Polyangium aurulentum TaxID=2567896 RepID=UPI00146BBFDC|nr:VOC family protein [Polyangium aurulentum]UQA55156.1 VOC family protein [Polyangium aurulentum]
MSVHHIALATRDLAATHRFYTEVMGFRLVKVICAAWPGSEAGGWAKHVFYSTSDDPNTGLIAFWEVNEPSLEGNFRSDLSTGLGLPQWVNHLAFTVPTEEALAAKRARWVEHGLPVTDMDHDFCRSIYTTDPNGTMVEFCVTMRSFTAEEVQEAERLVFEKAPAEIAPEPVGLPQ